MYNTNLCYAGMHEEGQQCMDLIKKTADTLSSSTVALILLSVQKDNLELNIKKAAEWYVLMHSGTRIRDA